MRKISRLLCPAAMLLLFIAPANLFAQGSSAPVSLTFTLTDESTGQSVTTLRREDVRFTEEGVPQEVRSLERRAEVPLSLSILIDNSLSQQRTIKAEKFAARAFVDAIVRPGKDSVSVSSFNAKAKLEQDQTSDAALLKQAIGRIKVEVPPDYDPRAQVILINPPYRKDKPVAPDPNAPPIPSTNIWDTLWETCENSLEKSPAGSRRAIILLTDGEDSSSTRKMKDAIERAIRAGVVVYSIGIGDEYYGGTNKDTLRKLSERTGGRAFFPKTDEDLRVAFVQVGQALRSQYVITYEPAGVKRAAPFRKVKVEIVNPELRGRHLQIAYPQGYFTN